jgi:hypothetical protein
MYFPVRTGFKNVAATWDSTKDSLAATVTALGEDQTIQIHARASKDNTPPVPIQDWATVVESLGYDWGLVKAYCAPLFL